MKKLLISTILIGILFGLITVIGSLLLALGIISFGAFGIIFIATDCVIGGIFALLCYVLFKLKEIEHKNELEKAIENERQMQLLSLYKRFDIPPQKDADGKLLNFYELLGIEPVFDEHGERIPTVYEILNILPRFDKNGVEIPCVVFIKNKTKKISENVPQMLIKLQSLESFKIAEGKKAQNQEQQKVVTATNDASKSDNGGGSKKKDKKKKEPKAQKYVGMITSSSDVKNSANESLKISDLLGDMFGDKDDFVFFLSKRNNEKITSGSEQNSVPPVKRNPEPAPVMPKKPEPQAQNPSEQKNNGEIEKPDISEFNVTSISGDWGGGSNEENIELDIFESKGKAKIDEGQELTVVAVLREKSTIILNNEATPENPEQTI